MTQELAGKIALVTGGSRGIGAAIAERLAENGADVAITYAGPGNRGEQVAARIRQRGRRAVVFRADASDPDAGAAAVDRTVAELGALDVLVNNAGVFPAGPVEEVTTDELQRTLAVHVGSVFTAARAAAGVMGDGGRIISIGSCFVERASDPGVTLYTMSKSALVGLTKGLARDLGPRGITANVVHPGNTDTDMNPADGPDAAEAIRDVALGRFAQPSEIAATVAHLAGPGGSYITGTAISVDGGFAA